MVNSSEVSQWTIRGLNLALLLLIVWVLSRYAYHAWLQYKRGSLYDLEQKEKAEAKRLASLTDKQLIDNANKGLGIEPKPPAD